MVVVSMSKQKFSRLEALLRVQTGRLRIARRVEQKGPCRSQLGLSLY